MDIWLIIGDGSNPFIINEYQNLIYYLISILALNDKELKFQSQHAPITYYVFIQQQQPTQLNQQQINLNQLQIKRV